MSERKVFFSLSECMCICETSTRGHMEERKQEMPDVHQPDLSVAGEPEECVVWGYLHCCHMIHPP